LSEKIKGFRDLKVYQAAFSTAMEIFQLSKGFPPEERYSLTDQIRRSSRSVCTNLSEGWRKRKYPAVFANKLSDSMQEASETQAWLDFCLACGYLDETTVRRLDEKCEKIIGMLDSMMLKSDKFCYGS